MYYYNYNKTAVIKKQTNSLARIRCACKQHVYHLSKNLLKMARHLV